MKRLSYCFDSCLNAKCALAVWPLVMPVVLCAESRCQPAGDGSCCSPGTDSSPSPARVSAGSLPVHCTWGTHPLHHSDQGWSLLQALCLHLHLSLSLFHYILRLHTLFTTVTKTGLSYRLFVSISIPLSLCVSLPLHSSVHTLFTTVTKTGLSYRLFVSISISISVYVSLSLSLPLHS